MNLLNAFLKKFKSKKKKFFLGIDIGSYSIKVAEFTVANGTPILNGFAQAKTSETAVINKIINDESLLKTNIKNLLANFSPSADNIYLSIPYEILFFGKFTIRSPELLQVRNIEKMINDEIPYKIEDVYYSYFILPEKSSYDVFYLVAKKDNIDKLKKIFDELNYKIENIDADFINLHNFFEYLYGHENKGVIDWGHEKIKIYFSNKNEPIYTRELFNLGLKHIKNEIIKEFKVTPELAEKYLISPPNDLQKNRLKDLLKKYIIKLTEEINLSIDLIKTKFNVYPESLYLIGGGALIPGISSILSNLLKFDIKEIKIEEKIKICENIDKNYLKVINSQGILALATAFKEII